MIIGINASFARKPQTGIGQVTINFLKKLIELKVSARGGSAFGGKNEQIKVILYLEEDLPRGLKLPKSFEKRVFLPLWRRDDLIRKTWWEKFSLPRRVKKDMCDVFISLYQCPTILFEIKHIMLVHDIVPKLFPEYLANARKEIYWKLTERAIKMADKIFAISKNTEKDLIKHLGLAPEKISLNYIDVDEVFKKGLTDKERARVLKKYKLKSGYILAGGGYEKRKNVEGVIRAYKIMLERNKNDHAIKPFPQLAVYGKILPPSLSLALDARKLVRELNLTEHVKLLDTVPQKDMPAIFSSASVFVYPSHYEGFGLPVLEAMNVGAPVITSKISSMPEVGSDAVLYCHADDPKDIAMVMRNVLLHKDLSDMLKRRGRERSGKFSWEKFTQKIWNNLSTS